MRTAAFVVVSVLATGCAARTPRAHRFIHRSSMAAAEASTKGRQEQGDGAKKRATTRTDGLEQYMARLRAIQAAARTVSTPAAVALENQNAELSSARLQLAAAPTIENQRRVAGAYLQAGILDAAYDHYTAALRLQPTDAASFDGLARIWRDWGQPDRALNEAYHAIYYAPDSAAAHNTLGTVLQRLGQTKAAQSAFETAVRHDPSAPYALNNLCYVNLLQQRAQQAIEICGRALRANPDLIPVHNNLALAYWIAGDPRAATAAFESSPRIVPGQARYNTGLALLASRQFREAAQAFEEASVLAPTLTLARRRAAQARILAAGSAADHQ